MRKAAIGRVLPGYNYLGVGASGRGRKIGQGELFSWSLFRFYSLHGKEISDLTVSLFVSTETTALVYDEN